MEISTNAAHKFLKEVHIRGGGFAVRQHLDTNWFSLEVLERCIILRYAKFTLLPQKDPTFFLCQE